MDYFDEKARQISEDALAAFGIPLTTRYAKADEMAEMLMFAQFAAARGLHTLVKAVFYDSKACLCTVELHSEDDFQSEAGAALKECAERALRQFQWDGTVYHGASLSDGDAI